MVANELDADCSTAMSALVDGPGILNQATHVKIISSHFKNVLTVIAYTQNSTLDSPSKSKVSGRSPKQDARVLLERRI
jgi:hypothetical protein